MSSVIGARTSLIGLCRVVLAVVVTLLMSMVAFAGEVALEVWSFSIRPDGLKVLNEQIIPAFEESHPGIAVEWLHIPYNQFTDKLVAGIASGIGPDIIIDGNNMTGWRLHNGITIPLDNLIARWDQADDILGLELGKYRGQVGTIPYEIKASPVAYRVDRFNDAGLDAGHPPETIQEYLEYARRLTRTDGSKVTQAGTGFPGPSAAHNYYRMLNMLVQMGGGWILDENSERTTYVNELGEESLQWMKDLWQSAVAPPGFDPLDGDYREGNEAMIFFQADLVNYLHGYEDARSVTRVALPLMKSRQLGKRVTIGGGNGVSISAYSDHQAEAWEFVKFIMIPENQVAVHLANGTVPSSRAAYAWPEFGEDPVMAGVIAAGPHLLSHDRGETTPAYRGNSRKFGEPLVQAVMGEISVKQGLEESARIFQNLIDEVLSE